MTLLAQLIKLQDYVSRYEWNAYRYPSQFIRLKQDNWKKLYARWQEPLAEVAEEIEQESPKLGALSKIKALMRKNDVDEEEQNLIEENLPETEAELKQHFLNRIFDFQLKWATSTVTELSYMNRSYYTDSLLKFFLQRFPDNYLCMYYPIFTVKSAPVDGEIILISPIGIEIIYIVEEDNMAKVFVESGRTWKIISDKQEKKILSPQIALKRTEQIVTSILRSFNIEFPVQKTVLSRRNTFIFNEELYQTKLVGVQQYEEWFKQKRSLASPLKSQQLKVAEALLKHSQTTSVKRPEWEEDEDPFLTTDHDISK
ncbi:NERD domain-containing protein [Virgibacillus halodenitrificans]|uniref:NERD domain-containing protein n=1 Tax=Virgibacillus halodenitrificans TaxID=1482 RepID=UPI002DB9799B|nr:NERD domain-containing protein [Virgibacillus halodenitrificans]MEC2159798.1 NERD domain-containing protein [Virgibacillus halodenitrificans]